MRCRAVTCVWFRNQRNIVTHTACLQASRHMADYTVMSESDLETTPPRTTTDATPCTTACVAPRACVSMPCPNLCAQRRGAHYVAHPWPPIPGTRALA
eukprot:4284877-Prymnesium_polylepis.1